MVVTYFVRMIAKEGQAENVLDLLSVNPKRIEEGEQGNIVFGVHRSIDNPKPGKCQTGSMRPAWSQFGGSRSPLENCAKLGPRGVRLWLW
jgi:hypothetical protein